MRSPLLRRNAEPRGRRGQRPGTPAPCPAHRLALQGVMNAGHVPDPRCHRDGEALIPGALQNDVGAVCGFRERGVNKIPLDRTRGKGVASAQLS